MALILRDRVKETTTTTGTGTITLAGAVAGFQSFSVIGNANTTYYAIVGGTEFEVGIGTYTSSGTTLSRDTVLTSSNSGNKVDFSAGEKDVFCTQPADKTVVKDSDSGDISIGDNLNINFGAGSDLNLLHNNSYGNIIDTNDKVLNMICGTGGTVSVNNGVFSSGFKAAAIFDPDGAQSIRYDGVTKFATTSSGATVTGTLTADGVSLGDNEKVQLGASNDLQMYHNTYGYIDNNTSHLYIRNNVDDDDGGNIYIQAKSGENSIVCNDDSSIQLYYDNSLRVSISSSINFYATVFMSSYDLYVNDVFFNGNIDGSDNDKILLGTSDDLQIYHDGTDNLIVPTNGQLVIARESTGTTELQIGGLASTGGNAEITLVPVTGAGSAIINATNSGSLILETDGTSRANLSASALTLNTDVDLVFEGSTADANETTLTVADPTADRTITLPDATGTVILNTNLNFPFFKSDGSSDTIALTADSKLPFTKSDGSASNISLTT